MERKEVTLANSNQAKITTTKAHITSTWPWLKNISEQQRDRIAAFDATTPHDMVRLKIYTMANHGGKKIRDMDPQEMAASLIRTFTELQAILRYDAIDDKSIFLFIDSIRENFGYLKPCEVRHALKAAASGSLDGAPEFYNRLGMDWIGGVLNAYRLQKASALKFVSDRLPAPKETEEEIRKKRLKAEADFVEVVRGQYQVYKDDPSQVVSFLLPDIFDWLDKGPESDRFPKVSIEKRFELLEASKAPSQTDSISEAIMKMRDEATPEARAKRRAKSAACRLLFEMMVFEGIEI